MKRVLMIVPFFPPMAGGGVHRPLAFVRNLHRFGWMPTVVAPGGDAFWLRDEALLERVPGGVEVHRTASLSGQSLLSLRRRGGVAEQKRSSKRFGLLRRAASTVLIPDTYVGWYPFASRAAGKLLSTGAFDALYSTSPPETSHLVARKLKKRTGIPWVADFRDPWMNLHLLPPVSHFHRKVHAHLERQVVRGADRVVVTTRWHEAALGAIYGDARIARIPNGYDGDAMEAVVSVAPQDTTFTIVHAGMLTQTRTVAPLVAGLQRFLMDRSDARRRVSITLVGPREDANEHIVAGAGLEDLISFRDSVSHAEALRMQKSAHALLLIKHVNADYVGLVPGKLYEYIGLEKPILALVPPGEAADVVSGYRRGEVAHPEDPAAVAAAIGRMYARFETGDLLSSYELSPRPECDRRTLTGDLAAVLNDVCAEARK